RAALPAYLPAAVAGGLAVHAVLAGLARPAGTAVVLGALVAVAFAVAALDRPARTGIGAAALDRSAGTGIGAAAVLAGLLALPGGTAAGAAWAGASAAVTRGWAAAGLVLAAAGLAAVRRWWPEYALAGATGVGLAGSAVALAVLPDHRFGEDAALAVLLDVVVWRLVRRWFVGFVVFTGIAAVPALVAALPATWTVFRAPYTWLDAVWRGRPSGVGLAPDGGAGYATATAALTLLGLVLAVVAATVG